MDNETPPISTPPINPTPEVTPTKEAVTIPKSKLIWFGLILVGLLFIAGSFFLGRYLGIGKSNSPAPVATTPTPTEPMASSTPTLPVTPPATPSVTPTPVPTPPPPPPAGPTPGNFAGHWVHNFGTMDLTQNGTSMTGTYHNSFDGGNGTVAGSVSGNSLTGTYQKASSGSISWTLSSNGNTFDGNWGGSNKWCGAKSGTAFPDGCAFGGKWNINIPTYCPAGNASSVMQLTQTDTLVTGTYCNGTLSGAISYSGGQALVSGTFQASGGGAGNLTFYLNGYSSTQFQGNFSSGTGTWCGWRDSSSQPSPCKK